MNSLEIRDVITNSLQPFILNGKGLTQKRIIDNSHFQETPAFKITAEIDLMCTEGIITKVSFGSEFYYKLA